MKSLLKSSFHRFEPTNKMIAQLENNFVVTFTDVDTDHIFVYNIYKSCWMNVCKILMEHMYITIYLPLLFLNIP